MNLEDFFQIDANALGEALREITFVGEGLGCRGNFDLREEAIPFSKEQQASFWITMGNEIEDAVEQADQGAGCSFWFQNYFIEMCYYWDGDGTLAFRVRDQDLDDPAVAFIYNDDCKKTYEWKHVKE